jgi:hypothetical protein
MKSTIAGQTTVHEPHGRAPLAAFAPKIQRHTPPRPDPKPKERVK